MATAATSSTNLISSENVQGTTVYDTKGTNIGTIDHLMIDKMSGRVVYALMSFGGFLGLGANLYPVPWSSLKYDTSLGGYLTGITAEQLKSAPTYTDDTVWGNREWEDRVHTNYGASPYWGAGI